MDMPQLGIGKPYQRRTGVNALQWDGESLSVFKQFTGESCTQIEKDLMVVGERSNLYLYPTDWLVIGSHGFFKMEDGHFQNEFEPVNPSPPQEGQA